MNGGKFETRAPSSQNAVDIFSGKWATNLDNVCGVENTGHADLFFDARIALAAECLGKTGRFDGMSVLELGPLEGAHTYQIEKLGASPLIAIESNTEAFLKCLVVKELLAMTAKFRCGDFCKLLEAESERYDLIFASGVLYHMSDPVSLIKSICDACDKCFIWTHYQSDTAIETKQRNPKHVTISGFSTTLFEMPYPDMQDDHFWGGNRETAAWMPRDEIIRAFAFFGLNQHRILQDHPGHPAGASFSFGVWR